MKLAERCDICGCDEHRIIYKRKWDYAYDLVQCDDCRLISIYPKQPSQKLQEHYNLLNPLKGVIPEKDLGLACKKIKRLNSPLGKAVLFAKGYGRGRKINFFSGCLGELLKKFTFKNILDFHGNGRILDIGCNTGLYLYMLKNIGWEVFGMDLDKKACDTARSLGIEVFAGFLKDAPYQDRFFDFVRFSHVIEHVDSPRELMQDVSRILKKDGRAYVAFPNQRSFAFYAFKHIWQGRGSHQYAFSRKTFAALCEKTGFKIDKARVKSSTGAMVNSMIIWAKFQKSPFKDITIAVAKSKLFKTFLVRPFCFILDVFGLGDVFEAELRLR